MKSIRMEPTELPDDWQEIAKQYNLDSREIERKSKFIYMSRWKELPNGRFPPVWESASNEVRDWVRRNTAIGMIA